MRIALNILGILFILIGIVWILQGLNILTQGAMAGHHKWSVIGSGMVVVGVLALFLANRRKKANS
jgi:hypothetical protein